MRRESNPVLNAVIIDFLLRILNAANSSLNFEFCKFNSKFLLFNLTFNILMAEMGFVALRLLLWDFKWILLISITMLILYSRFNSKGSMRTGNSRTGLKRERNRRDKHSLITGTGLHDTWRNHSQLKVEYIGRQWRKSKEPYQAIKAIQSCWDNTRQSGVYNTVACV